MNDPNKPVYATLTGHQAKLLKNLCRLLLAYIKYRVAGLDGNFQNLEKEVDRMEKLLGVQK